MHKTAEQRTLYFDFLRGVAIMMVVAIHTYPGLTSLDSLGDWVSVLLRQLINCAVPIFLAISGYFITKKDLSDKRRHLSFVKRQVAKIYVPCLVCSSGWFMLYLAGQRDEIVTALAMLLCCGFSVYYFVALIIQLYIVTPYMPTNRKGVFVSALISSLSIVLVTYMMQIEGRDFALIAYAGPFVLWVVFFVLGGYLSQHDRDYPLTYPLLITVAGLVASMFESRYYFMLNGSGLGIKLSSFVYSSGIILVLFSAKCERLFRENRATRAILFIGEISFAIYLLHMYVKFALDHFMHTDIWVIDWLLTLVITVAGLMVCRKSLPPRLLKYTVGLK